MNLGDSHTLIQIESGGKYKVSLTWNEISGAEITVRQWVQTYTIKNGDADPYEKLATLHAMISADIPR